MQMCPSVCRSTNQPETTSSTWLTSPRKPTCPLTSSSPWQQQLSTKATLAATLASLWATNQTQSVHPAWFPWQPVTSQKPEVYPMVCCYAATDASVMAPTVFMACIMSNTNIISKDTDSMIMFGSCAGWILCSKKCRIQDFSEGGANPTGANYLAYENCMKMKEQFTEKGEHPSRPLRSANGNCCPLVSWRWQRHW